MADTPNRERGTIITYLDPDRANLGNLQRAVITGVGVPDPESEVVWVPVVRPDCEVTLVDPAMIVDDATPRPRPETGQALPAPVNVLAHALHRLAGKLSEVDEHLPSAAGTVQGLLSEFVDAITPVEFALCVLIDDDPRGPLAGVLTCVGSAAEEFERGNVTDGKVGILLANATMAELAADGDDPD